MKKIYVYVQETLCREVLIEVDDELEVEERMDLAAEKVREMYRNQEIVLTAEDYVKTEISVLDYTTEECSEWDEM